MKLYDVVMECQRIYKSVKRANTYAHELPAIHALSTDLGAMEHMVAYIGNVSELNTQNSRALLAMRDAIDLIEVDPELAKSKLLGQYKLSAVGRMDSKSQRELNKVRKDSERADARRPS